MIQRILQNRFVQRIATCIFAVGALSWVGMNSGPPGARVLLHVLERDVDVRLAGHDYHFDEMSEKPIVLELRPGRHDFRVTRANTTIHAEQFTLNRGESLVLVAVRDQRGARPPKGRISAPSTLSGQASTPDSPASASTPTASSALPKSTEWRPSPRP